MRELHTSIEIDSTPERVWEILTDFPSYPEWNPFIRSIAGEVVPGAELRVRIQPPGGRAMRFTPTVLEAAPQRELRWLGHLFVPRLFDGEHRFHIEAVGEGRVRFAQAERFTGVLVPLLARTLDPTRRGFEAMNEALKRRAEQPAER
jgi:hypothetical protein